ncbi:MAG: tRNA uridine-5-carboxymethylaminomethyl(34) synthesis GTPase MnmE, partial [Bacilli bacterium]|nr:tRNA uridine-5-carboxymethylaminomethyl(34) synthesis GTPase MnmE [Bacilli bacterium]
EIIDEVLVSIMRKPKTFTREDIVEINSHGGLIVTNKILELLIREGARLAEPGEFTKRAFLNGRIDLLEAEAVMDLINAKSESARKLAMNQVTGKISNQIIILRAKIMEVMANIEVNIDYPEYDDVEEVTYQLLTTKIKEIIEPLEKLQREAHKGRIIKEGIKTIIVGRPNVGKSSILNKLIDEDKAIVTDIAGTTRDIVEGDVMIDGILLNIFDTAGIRRTKNIIEQKGVAKTMSLIEESDLIILVLNNNEALKTEDITIIKKTNKKPRIIVINKADLPTKIKLEGIVLDNVVRCNAIEEDGLIPLKNQIKALFELETIETANPAYLSNIRQQTLISQAQEALQDALTSIKKGIPIDLIQIDIKRAWNLLGEIIGATYQDDIIDQLFSHFCLGK